MSNLLLTTLLINISGNKPINVISNAGKDANISCSELAYSKVVTDNVLKLKGLNIKVSGNSLRISIKTNNLQIARHLIAIAV